MFKQSTTGGTGGARSLRRTVVAGGLVVACASGLAACGGDSGSSGGSGNAGGTEVKAAASTDPAVKALNDVFGPGGEEAGEGVTINNGMLLAMTGQGAYFGRVMSQGAKLAASQVKAAGGPEFKISIGDHEDGAIQAGVAATRRMISQDKITTLQTSYGAVSEAIIPQIQQAKVLTFQGGGPSPGQVEKDYLWNNRMLFGDAPAPGALTWLAKQHPDAKRLAIVGTSENATNAIKTLVPQIWPKVQDGGTIATTQIHDVGVTDFGSVIAKIKASKADAIWNASFGNDPGYFVKAVRQAGLDIPIILSEFTSDACKVDPKAMSSVHAAADYFDPNSENPLARSFTEAYRAAYDTDPDFYAANYYEQILIVWELVKRVIAEGGDPQDGAALQAALIKDPKFPSLYGGDRTTPGEIVFDPKLHTVSKPMNVLEISSDCVPSPVADITAVGPDADPTTALVSASR
jgi:branched-chain amino acid transport system substrate-binding protein